MRLPDHKDHDIAECDACAVFDQVHAERDDLKIRIAQIEAMGVELADSAYRWRNRALIAERDV